MILLLLCQPLYAAEEKKEEEGVEAPTEASVVEPSREEEMSKLVEANLQSGEAIWLGNVDDAFLSLYEEDTSRNTQGGVLILHDLGANANWPQLILPLRLTLAEKGWHTLSIQLPMVSPDADKQDYLKLFDESVSRVNLGIEQLQQQNIENIVVIGHGVGGAIGAFYLSQTDNAPVTAFVTISLVGEDVLKPEKKEVLEESPVSEPLAAEKTPAEKKKVTAEPEQNSGVEEEPPLPERDLFAEMEKVVIPFFDIYAEQDHQDVMREAHKRMEVMRKSENQNYSQWQVSGADHYFRGHEARLIKRLRGWLKKNAEGEVIANP